MLDSGKVGSNFRFSNGDSLLITACKSGFKKLAKALIRRGAPLDDVDIVGNTAAHWSFAMGHQDLAEYSESCILELMIKLDAEVYMPKANHCWCNIWAKDSKRCALTWQQVPHLQRSKRSDRERHRAHMQELEADGMSSNTPEAMSSRLQH